MTTGGWRDRGKEVEVRGAGRLHSEEATAWPLVEAKAFVSEVGVDCNVDAKTMSLLCARTAAGVFGGGGGGLMGDGPAGGCSRCRKAGHPFRCSSSQ